MVAMTVESADSRLRNFIKDRLEEDEQIARKAVGNYQTGSSDTWSFEGYAESATVSLSRTDWSGAALFDVDFRRANLYGATLRNTVLVRCNLKGVNLCTADLTGARLVGCETTGAAFDGATF